MVAGVAAGVLLFIVVFAIVFLVLYKKLPTFRRRLTFLGPRRVRRSERAGNIVDMEASNSPPSDGQHQQEKITASKPEQTNCPPETQVTDFSSNEPLLSSDESLSYTKTN